MPVTYGNYTKQLKLLPLTLFFDGSASVTVRFGFVGADGEFEAVSERVFSIPARDVSDILDAPSSGGLTRRDDLSLAVYQYLVDKSLVEPGTIS